MEKPSYFSVLTADVRYDPRLKHYADCKVLYSEITALSNKDGYCHASNSYFARLYDRPVQTISKWINLLKEFGYLKVEMVRSGKQIVKRKMFPISTPIKANVNTPINANVKGGIHADVKGGIHVNVKENNTSINKTSKNKDIGQARPDTSPTRKKIIDYLNSKLGTSYKPNASKNKQVINARLNEGYTFDDFKKVIDNKSADWEHDAKMSKYLRPETLFGTKMEGYVNEKSSASADKGYHGFADDSYYTDHTKVLDDVSSDDLPF